MRSFPFTAAVLLAAMAFGTPVSAQVTSGPTIQTATVAAGGLLIISGTGFGADAAVTIEGQPVTVLPGGSDTQVTVLAPASVLTTAGTYRLTVTVPGQPADVFVIASQPGSGAAGLSGTTQAATSGAASDRRVTAAAAHSPMAGATAETAQGPAVTESNCKTAVGMFALLANTTGCHNVASGYAALYSNTSGWYNTADGVDALYFNTTGWYNTASGHAALYRNTTGHDNTASGFNALSLNTTGFYNTASGYSALFSNTIGDRNSASGAAALYANTTGYSNTANGEGALYGNTTGAYNTANGAEALFANTTGTNNTAIGHTALQSSTTGGANVAVGNSAGYNATTGSYNVFLGAAVQGTAADTNTIRIGLPYSGGVGQNKTLVAGIYNTGLDASNGVQIVWVDKNGQLGTLMQPASAGGGAVTVPPPASSQSQAVAPPALPGAMDQLSRTVQDQRAVNAELLGLLQEQQAVIAELRARLARLEALSVPAAGRNVAR